MECPLCSGVPPLYEQTTEKLHVTITMLWFEAFYYEHVPEDVLNRFDFNGVPGVQTGIIVTEQKKGGAVMTYHYCLVEGDMRYTLKGRVPLDELERASLFGFMKDSFRIEETRGRRRKLTVEDLRAILQRAPRTSVRKLALELKVSRDTVRQIIRDAGLTLTQLQRDAAEARRS